MLPHPFPLRGHTEAPAAGRCLQQVVGQRRVSQLGAVHSHTGTLSQPRVLPRRARSARTRDRRPMHRHLTSGQKLQQQDAVCSRFSVSVGLSQLGDVQSPTIRTGALSQPRVRQKRQQQDAVSTDRSASSRTLSSAGCWSASGSHSSVLSTAIPVLSANPGFYLGGRGGREHATVGRCTGI